MYDFPDYMMPPLLGTEALRESEAWSARLEADLESARRTKRPRWVSETPLLVELNEDRGDMRREIDSRFQRNEMRAAVRIEYELIDRGGGAAQRFAKYYIKESLVWADEVPHAMLAYMRVLPHPNSHLSLGMCYLSYRQYEKALENFRAAIELAPKSDTPTEMLRGQAYWSTAQLYQRLGDFATASRSYAKAADCYKEESRNFDHLVGHAQSTREMVDFCRFVESFDPAAVPDGTYTGSSLGYAGHIEVEVEVRGGVILRVEVVNHKESIPLHTLKTVPRRIVNSQSLNVEWVLGSKYTSRAIVAAVFRALETASPRAA